MSSVLAGGPPPVRGASQPPPAPSLAPGATAASQDGGQRSNTVTVLAGVGVLLLAMGVGVLIGRAGTSRPAAAPAQVITVGANPGGAGAAATGAAAASTFTDDWPSGTNGYTVQLQTLPVSGTAVTAVAAAKAAASAKGAAAVGALKSEDFSSLPAGNYVIYSGVYHTKAEASKALIGLKHSFPAAAVIAVSNGGSAEPSEGAGSTSHGSGANLSHPAPPSVVQTLRKSSGGGKSYEQKSKELPNVIETG